MKMKRKSFMTTGTVYKNIFPNDYCSPSAQQKEPQTYISIGLAFVCKQCLYQACAQEKMNKMKLKPFIVKIAPIYFRLYLTIFFRN